MRVVPLRRVADVNPATPEFDRLGPDDEVTFMPLETVWADDRVDFSRRAAKATVATGYTRFRNGDVLVPKVTPTFQAGRTAVAQLATAAGAGTTELHVIRARPGVSDQRFLAYVCRSKPFLDEGVSAFQGVAGLQRVPDEYLRSFAVADLPLEEQRRIADFLDTETARHDAAIAVRDAQAGLELERWRARVANAVLNVEGRPTPLKHLFESSFAGVWGGDPGSAEVDVLCARVADFDRENYRVADVPTVRGLVAHDACRKELQHGDVLLEKSGGTHAKPVGCAVIYEGPAGTVSSNFIQVLRPAAEFIPRFIGYLMAALYETRQNGAFVHQTTGIQNLDLGAYLSSTVAVPPVEAQRLAVQELDDAREKSRSMREALSRSASLIDERRQALITAAVTGQLDVTTAQTG